MAEIEIEREGSIISQELVNVSSTNKDNFQKRTKLSQEGSDKNITICLNSSQNRGNLTGINDIQHPQNLNQFNHSDQKTTASSFLTLMVRAAGLLVDSLFGLDSMEKNEGAIIEMIKFEPLKGKTYFYEKCIQQKIKASKSKIKELIIETREELFLFNSDVVLSDEYCKTKDPTCSQAFLQYKSEVRVPRGKNKDTILKPLVILASVLMLKQLQEKAWYMQPFL